MTGTVLRSLFDESVMDYASLLYGSPDGEGEVVVFTVTVGADLLGILRTADFAQVVGPGDGRSFSVADEIAFGVTEQTEPWVAMFDYASRQVRFHVELVTDRAVETLVSTVRIILGDCLVTVAALEHHGVFFRQFGVLIELLIGMTGVAPANGRMQARLGNFGIKKQRFVRAVASCTKGFGRFYLHHLIMINRVNLRE